MNAIQFSNIESLEKGTRNPHFYQFYKQNFNFVRFLVSANQSAAKVFFFIIENMDKQNALVVSQTALAEALKMGRTNIWKAIKYLSENKYLKIYRSGTSNIYIINCQIVWQQANNKKKFAKFNASVYISDSEQIKSGRTLKIGHFESNPNAEKVIKQNTLFDYEY